MMSNKSAINPDHEIIEELNLSGHFLWLTLIIASILVSPPLWLKLFIPIKPPFGILIICIIGIVLACLLCLPGALFPGQVVITDAGIYILRLVTKKKVEFYAWENISHFEERFLNARALHQVVFVILKEKLSNKKNKSEPLHSVPFKGLNNRKVIEKLNLYLKKYQPESVIPPIEESLQSPSGYFAVFPSFFGFGFLIFIGIPLLLIYFFMTIPINIYNQSHSEITDLQIELKDPVLLPARRTDYSISKISPREKLTITAESSEFNVFKINYLLGHNTSQCYIIHRKLPPTAGRYKRKRSINNKSCQWGKNDIIELKENSLEVINPNNCTTILYDCRNNPELFKGIRITPQ